MVKAHFVIVFEVDFMAFISQKIDLGFTDFPRAHKSDHPPIFC